MYRFIYEGLFDDTALHDWWVFMQDIRVHSGAHTHPGGLIIYVLEGAVHTVVDGVRHEWKEGDLLLLPIKPGGVEHRPRRTPSGRWVFGCAAGSDQIRHSRGLKDPNCHVVPGGGAGGDVEVAGVAGGGAGLAGGAGAGEGEGEVVGG